MRKIGSGNIGATNVLRTGNKGLAAATLLLDALKGTAAVLIAGWYAGPSWRRWPPGSAPSSATSFPVWLNFKGGKGVATYLGVLLGLVWTGALRLCRCLAGRRLPHALLLARRADRGARRPGVPLLPGQCQTSPSCSRS